MTCDRPMWGDSDSPLRCVRRPDHPAGHVYRATSGSDVPDHHTETCEEGQ